MELMTVLLLVIGAGLLYAAVKGKNPVEVFKGAFTK
jgi:hypothetical protein